MPDNIIYTIIIVVAALGMVYFPLKLNYREEATIFLILYACMAFVARKSVTVSELPSEIEWWMTARMSTVLFLLALLVVAYKTATKPSGHHDSITS